jgi:hypothetical protein
MPIIPLWNSARRRETRPPPREGQRPITRRVRTRGIADLQVLANLVPTTGFLHGSRSTPYRCGIHGFVANIFFEIDRPPGQFVVSYPDLVRHCVAVHAAIA